MTTQLNKLFIRVVNFEEFKKYGQDNSDNIVNGVPYSFNFGGLFETSHESDNCYLVPTKKGMEKFTDEELLIINENDFSYGLIKKEMLEICGLL